VANRYWVGGTSTWDATAGTKWALTSGGAGGQAVPTSADDVFFTAVSGAVTVTVSVAANAKTLDFTGFTGTFTTGFAVSIYGGLTLSSAMTLTINGVFINFLATTDNSGVGWPITTNGKAFTAGSANTYAFAGVGGKWVFQDNITFGNASTLTLQAGALDTNSKTVTVGNLTSSGAGVKSLTLGSSVVNLTLLNTPINMAGTNQTLSAGTSTINITPTANAGNWGTAAGFVWNNVVMAGTGAALLPALTCVNFTRTGTAVKTDSLTLSGNLICSGTFTCTGNSVINRMWLITNIPGNGFLIIASTFAVTLTDLMDISFAGYSLGSVVTSDSFNRANSSLGGSSTDLAAGGTAKIWGAPSTGTWNIVSNLVQTQLANISVSSITVDAGVRNVAVEAKFNALGLSANSLGLIIAAYVDSNNYVVGRVTSLGVLSSGYMYNGSLTVVNITGITVVAGDVVSIELIGPNIVTRLNGNYAGIFNMPAIVNTTLQGTRVGLAGTNNGVIINQFDDFKVSNCSPSVSLPGCGDCQGNSNIVFDPSVTQTASGTASFTWSTHPWTTRVPLPQDDVIINNAFVAGRVINMDMPRTCRDLNFTGTTGNPTAAGGNPGTRIFGNLTLIAGMTWNFGINCSLYFFGRSSQTITTAGVTTTSTNNGIVQFQSASNYSLQDAFSLVLATNSQLIFNGTLVTNSNSINVTNGSTAVVFGALSNTSLGTSVITITPQSAAIGLWSVTLGAIMSAASSTIVVSGVLTVDRTFGGGGQKYGTLTYIVPNSTGRLVITGSNYFDTWNIGPGRQVVLANGVLNTVKNRNDTGQSNGYLYLSSNGYASVPDSAATSITGNITVAVRVALNNYATGVDQALANKWSSNSQRSYSLTVGPTGALNFFGSNNGGGAQISNTSSVTGGFINGATYWVAVTYNSSTGDTKFYTASGASNVFPTGVSWTQLGTTVANTPIALFDATEQFLTGGQNTGTASAPAGKFYHTVLANNVLLNGTGIQCDMDFTTKAFGANTFTESSSNAATVTLNGVANVGDGRVAFSSQTSGTVTYLELVGPINTLNYQTVQDVFATVPYKYYAGANSVSISGNTNVTIAGAPANIPYINYQTPTNTVAKTSNTVTFSFSASATAGNLLVACFIASNNSPGTVSAPVGWTLADSTNNSSQAYNYVYYKIAAGGESTVTITMTTNSLTTSLKLFEIAGFSGTPLLDVKSKNNGSGVSSTSLSTGSAVSNTVNPGFAMALWGAGNIMGAGVSITGGFQESRPVVQDTIARFFVLPLTSIVAISPTYTWTSLRFATAQLVVFSGLTIGGNRNLPMLGVGS